MTHDESVKDPRIWAKISVDYFDNPKIDVLSDTAQLLHLSLILRAKQQRLGGKLSARSCEARGRAALKELVDGGLLIKAEARTYKLHDYEKHQTEVDPQRLSEERSKAGSRGGHTKNHARRFVYDEMCEHCQSDFNRSEEWLQDPRLTLKTA